MIINLCYMHAGCSFTVIPTRSSSLIAVAVLDSRTPNVTYLLADSIHIPENFHFNETDQLVNSSLCHIASLEVYRGRDQAIEINHGGFFLSDNGTIQVLL